MTLILKLSVLVVKKNLNIVKISKISIADVIHFVRRVKIVKSL